MKTKPARVKGHKRAQVSRGIRIICECGCESAMYFGRGASANAHGEYHWHLDQQRNGSGGRHEK